MFLFFMLYKCNAVKLKLRAQLKKEKPPPLAVGANTAFSKEIS
jgi:hypothetical protein